MTTSEFNEIVWDYYAKNSRDSLPWRKPKPDGSCDAYEILVSEFMLQQTQVMRVVPKFTEWRLLFPTIQDLASASVADVLTAWSGLGYNRRAKFLHEAAKRVVREYGGVLPNTQVELVKLPGVGKNTAGAVMAYAYNQPVVYIETNIRTVFLYYFYPDVADVTDSELTGLIGQTLDTENPREWYWAIMDLGTYIKKTKGNYSKNSKHHTKQSAFKGSKREVRGKVLKILISEGPMQTKSLTTSIQDPRLNEVLSDMQKEGLIVQSKGTISLAQ